MAHRTEKNKKTDSIFVTSLNLSGPEITFSTRLPVQTKLEVLAVRACKNCPFEKRIEYQVRVQPSPENFGTTPIYINLERVKLDALQCKTLQGSWTAP